MSVPAFIDITEADQIIELRQYFESKDIKVPEAESNDVFDEVKAIIQSTTNVWKDNDMKDIEGIVNSILSLLFVIPMNKGKELVVLLCDQLKLGAGCGKGAVSLKLLHNLFYGYHEKTPFLYDVYCTWIETAGQCGSIKMVPTNLKQIDVWLGWWKVSMEDRNHLLRLLYHAHINSSNSDDAAEVMVKLLEGYTDENAAQAREDAIRCITRAISDPNTYLFDQLLTLKPIMFLEGELIHDLLTIFVSGNVKDYLQFYEANSSFVESIGLSHTNNLNKIKLLTLVDSVGDSHDITFDDVIERLGISDDSVEEFVIDAMQRKLIRGRVDHVSRKVIISQACQRTFGRSQWQLLASRLKRWKDNLKKVDDRLQTVHPQG